MPELHLPSPRSPRIRPTHGSNAAWPLALAALATLTLAAPSSHARPGDDGNWPAIEAPAPAYKFSDTDAALIVTIEDYAFVSDVPGALANGRAWYRWFTETRQLRADRVKWLKDSEGTPSQILAAARQLRSRSGRGGTLWFVFVGHGAPSRDAKDGVLVGVSAQQSVDEFYAQSLSQRELFAALAEGPQASTVLVVDSCFSGRGGDGQTLSPGAQPVLLSERPSLPARMSLITAGQSTEFAGPLPWEPRPAFSYLVLGGLRGWADDGEYGDGNGVITPNELVSFARSALSTTLSGRNQTPQAFGEIDSPVVTVPKVAREQSPKLSAIVDAHAGRRAEPVIPIVTPIGRKPVRVEVDPVSPTTPSRLGGGAGDVGGGLDLSNLDLESLQQAEALSIALKSAKATEADPTASPNTKADAWDALAAKKVKGQNPYAAEARANAQSWRDVAALASKMRTDWAKIQDALKLSVIELDAKKKLVGQFLSAYAKLSAEPEVKSAKTAKDALDRGNEFPLSGGSAVTSGGSGSGRAPAGYVEIPAGTFTMGSPTNEAGRYDDEVQHEVRISRGFWMKQTEVTQGEWRAVMGGNPSRFESCGDSCPVEGVSWFDAVAYTNALSRKEGLEECYTLSGCSGTAGGGCSNWDPGYCTGDFTCSSVTFKGVACRGYRLPTEAEWEYAARAGTRTALYTGDLTIRGQNHGPELDPVAWYGGNSGVDYGGAFDCSGWPEKQRSSSRCGTHPVGQKQSNRWGLADMLGNVWEWVTDWKGDYSGGATDPTGPSSGGNRVVRGGSWFSDARFVRAALRDGNGPSFRYVGVGLRPLRSIP